MAGIKSIDLEACEPEGHTLINVADERTRAKAGEVNRTAVASITLDSDLDGGHSWGEFLTWADVAALHAWTGALLAETFADPAAGD